MRVENVKPGRTPVSHGHDPIILKHSNDRALVEALKKSQCKAMLTYANGMYEEIMLPLGYSGLPNGATCCYMNLEASIPQLRDWMVPVQLRNEAIDRVNAYISPPGCGTPLHFDIRTVWIVQLFGEKTWYVADRPAVPDPRRNCVAGRDGGTVNYDGVVLTIPDELHKTVLRPGDWLCVPRGVWHKTRSRTGSVSVSLAAPA